ncbi:MAG: hypothetical protein RMJ53_07675 [Chitinophagales bacterium]|nr:hypothetical protein [Candidatus Calescibacterium sp.]MDW8274090.1 hypothetical protein [Chitinophagales bacterium]
MLRAAAIAITLCISDTVFATKQIQDIIIIGADSFSLFSSPLEKYFEFIGSRNIPFMGYSTGCIKGYQAIWNIENDSLFLLKIRSCSYWKDNISVDLKKLFGTSSDKIFFKWYSDTLNIRYGKIIRYRSGDGQMIYEFEKLIVIRSGHVIKTISYNSIVRDSKFLPRENLTEMLEIITGHIRQHINWKVISTKHQKAKHLVKIKIDKNGKIYSVKTTDSTLEDELSRILFAMPNWEIIQIKNQPQEELFYFNIEYNKNKKIIKTFLPNCVR